MATPSHHVSPGAQKCPFWNEGSGIYLGPTPWALYPEPLVPKRICTLLASYFMDSAVYVYIYMCVCVCPCQIICCKCDHTPKRWRYTQAPPLPKLFFLFQRTLRPPPDQFRKVPGKFGTVWLGPTP